MFRDRLDKKKFRLLRACLAGFVASLRPDLGLLVWAFFFMGIIYATIGLEG